MIKSRTTKPSVLVISLGFRDPVTKSQKPLDKSRFNV